MTEKRFTLIECNGNIEDEYEQKVYDGGEDVYELLDLLNQLFKKILEYAENDTDNVDWQAYCEKEFGGL